MALDADSVKSKVNVEGIGVGIEMAATDQGGRDELVNALAERIVEAVDDLPWYVSWAVNERWVAKVINVVIEVVDGKLSDWLG